MNVRRKTAFLGRCLMILLFIRSWPGDLLSGKFLIIYCISGRVVCFVDNDIGKMMVREFSIYEV